MNALSLIKWLPLSLASLGFEVVAEEETRDQVIELQSGWNAVYLEVDPVDSHPDTVFRGTAITQAARLFKPVSQVQFISDPNEETWNRESWGIWYATDRPDAFLTNLHSIQGNHAYLIHSEKAFQWKVTGTVRFRRKAWSANTYNLMGFNVSEQSPPTFETFFEGAEGKIGKRILRLDENKWQLVRNPESQRMRSGEAYWILCQGRTDYQGPLDLKIEGSDVLDFGERGGVRKVIYANHSSRPQDIELHLVHTEAPLKLQQLLFDSSKVSDVREDLRQMQYLARLESSEKRQLRLRPAHEKPAGGTHQLLKMSSNLGVEYWIPARSVKP